MSGLGSISAMRSIAMYPCHGCGFLNKAFSSGQVKSWPDALMVNTYAVKLNVSMLLRTTSYWYGITFA